MPRKPLVIFYLLAIIGCSLYQSQGRDFLENNGDDYITSARIELACHEQPVPQEVLEQDQSLLLEDGDTVVKKRVQGDLDLAVWPASMKTYCRFQYTNPEEQAALGESDIKGAKDWLNRPGRR